MSSIELQEEQTEKMRVCFLCDAMHDGACVVRIRCDWRTPLDSQWNQGPPTDAMLASQSFITYRNAGWSARLVRVDGTFESLLLEELA
jgi:hypothetical protein